MKPTLQWIKKKSVIGDVNKKPGTNTDKNTPGGAGSKLKPKTEMGANNYLPQTLEQWSTFELSEEIHSSWSHELMEKIGINQTTIIEPYLLFYYLDLLAKMLNEEGYSNLLFPIFNFQLILINCVLKYDMESTSHTKLISMNAYVRFKIINLCIELNLIQAVSFNQQLLHDLIVTPDPTAPSSTINNNSNPINLLKLLQIDPIEVCLVRLVKLYKNKKKF
jgi:hypothetical protein